MKDDSVVWYVTWGEQVIMPSSSHRQLTPRQWLANWWLGRWYRLQDDLAFDVRELAEWLEINVVDRLWRMADRIEP